MSDETKCTEGLEVAEKPKFAADVDEVEQAGEQNVELKMKALPRR